MAAGAKRIYVAQFSIGAKLAGSFKSAMSAAQARMKALNASAIKAGSSVLKYASKIGGLLSVFGTFAASRVLSDIFSDASKEASDAHQRTRALQRALMQNDEIRAGGLDKAKQQADLVQKHNKLLQDQGVIHHSILDAMSEEIEKRTAMPTRDLNKMMTMAQDILVEKAGPSATMAEGMEVAGALANAASKGRTMGLGKELFISKEWNKSMMKILGTQARVDKVMKKLDGTFKGIAAAEALTDEGRIQRFNNAMTDMKENIGDLLLPVQAEMADTWKAALPDIGKGIGLALKFVLLQVIKLAKWLKGPEWKQFKEWASLKLSPAWDDLRKNFDYMIDHVGPAFNKMLDDMGIHGDDWKAKMGNALLWTLKEIGRFFRWVGDNADWLLPLVKNLAIAFAALDLVLAAFDLLDPLTATAAGVIAVGLGVHYLNSKLDELRKRKDAVGDITRAFKEFDDSFSPAARKDLLALVNGLWSVFSYLYDKAEPIRTAIWNWEGALLKAVLDPSQKILEVWRELSKIWENRPWWLGGGTKSFTPTPMMPPGTPLYYSGHSAPPMTTGFVPLPAPVPSPLPSPSLPSSTPVRAIGPWGQRVGMLGSGSAQSITYAPQITINGDMGPSDQQDLSGHLRRSAKEFIAEFNEAQKQERRLSFQSAYA